MNRALSGRFGMLDRLIIEIPGVPVPKARARVTRSGIAYTPKSTREYERDLRLIARDRMMGKEPFDGPITIEICAYLPVPESWPRWKSEKVTEHGSFVSHTVKPDFDNLGKVIDAFNGVVWVDDSQITDSHIYKRYSRTPSLIVDVTHDPRAIHSKTRRKVEA